MKHPQDKPTAEPRLAPTGSVDEVLFTGKRNGKNLTLLQSVGLAVWGLCVVLGVGVPSIVGEFSYTWFAPDWRAVLFGGVLSLAGAVWMVIGIASAIKAVRARNRRCRRLQNLECKRQRGGV